MSIMFSNGQKIDLLKTNVWNINADYSYKGHDMYLGIYYNDRAYDENGNAMADNKKEIR